MGNKFYAKLTIATPVIAALLAPSVAYADTKAPETQVPATFTAQAPAAPTSQVDFNNTQVVELTPAERLEFKNVILDAGDESISFVAQNACRMSMLARLRLALRLSMRCLRVLITPVTSWRLR